MPQRVQLSSYGGVDELRIVDVAVPQPAAGEVIVRVVAAGTNPGEISIREGYLKDMFPRDFPFGQGTDFSGRIESVGAGVTGLAAGDDVLGWPISAQLKRIMLRATRRILSRSRPRSIGIAREASSSLRRRRSPRYARCP